MHPAPSSSRGSFRQVCASRLDAFDGLVRELTGWCNDAGVPANTLHDVILILDELFSNIVIHGYRYVPDGDILVEALASDGQVDVTLTDHAPAFNPLLVPPPNTRLPLEERPIGGLGLLFVRRTADQLQYWRIAPGLGEAANRLQFTKHFSRG